ncbi:MAG: hypothetical protein AVDCRST_MAG64-2058, partial [uncultured Phycisphaerae bacterium]
VRDDPPVPQGPTRVPRRPRRRARPAVDAVRAGGYRRRHVGREQRGRALADPDGRRVPRHGADDPDGRRLRRRRVRRRAPRRHGRLPRARARLPAARRAEQAARGAVVPAGRLGGPRLPHGPRGHRRRGPRRAGRGHPLEHQLRHRHGVRRRVADVVVPVEPRGRRELRGRGDGRHARPRDRRGPPAGGRVSPARRDQLHHGLRARRPGAAMGRPHCDVDARRRRLARRHRGLRPAGDAV